MSELNLGISLATNAAITPQVLEDLIEKASLAEVTTSKLISGSHLVSVPGAAVGATGDAEISETHGDLRFRRVTDGAFVALTSTVNSISLTNQNASTAVTGEVVLVDTANDFSFVTTAPAGLIASNLVVGVVMEEIAPSSAGPVCTRGITPVQIASTSGSAGDLLAAHGPPPGIQGAAQVDPGPGTFPGTSLFATLLEDKVSSGVTALRAFVWR